MSLSKNVQERKEDSARFFSPLQFCIEKSIFQVILIILSGLLFFNGYAVLSSVPSYSRSQYNQFSLKFSLAADGPYPFAADWCLLTLLRKGCAVDSKNFSVSNDVNKNSPFLGPISLPIPIIMDGFEVAISTSAMGSAFAAGLLLLASPDGGGTWSVAGSSTLRYLPRSARFLSPEPVPWSRGDGGQWQLRADFRPPWPAVAEPALASGLAGVGLLAIAILGALGRPTAGRRATCWLCLLLAVNSFTAAAALVSSGGGRRAAFRPLAEAALLASVGTGLLFRGGERLFFIRLLAAAAAAVLVRVIDDCAVYSDAGNLAASPPAAALAAAAWAAGFLLLNEAFLRRCVAAVAADRARHDAAWARLQSDPAERAALDELEAACKGLTDACGRLPRARQLNRPRIRTGGLVQVGGGGAPPPPPRPRAEAAAASANGVGADAAGADSEGPMGARWRRARHSSTLSQLHTLLRWDARDEDFESRNTVPGRADESSPVTSLDQLYGKPPPPRAALAPGPSCDWRTRPPQAGHHLDDDRDALGRPGAPRAHLPGARARCPVHRSRSNTPWLRAGGTLDAPIPLQEGCRGVRGSQAEHRSVLEPSTGVMRPRLAGSSHRDLPIAVRFVLARNPSPGGLRAGLRFSPLRPCRAGFEIRIFHMQE